VPSVADVDPRTSNSAVPNRMLGGTSVLQLCPRLHVDCSPCPRTDLGMSTPEGRVPASTASPCPFLSHTVDVSRGRSPRGWAKHNAAPIRCAANQGVSFAGRPLLGVEAAAWDAQRAPRMSGLVDLLVELGFPGKPARYAEDWARVFRRETTTHVWAPENWPMVHECTSCFTDEQSRVSVAGPGRPPEADLALAAAALRAKPWGPLPWSIVLAVLGCLGLLTPPIDPENLPARERAAEAIRALVRRERKR
jgi:hypothetical protein